MDEQTATNATDIPTVPATWPGAFGLYKHSKKAVLVNIKPLAIIWIVAFLLGIPLDWKLKQSGGGLINFLVSAFASIGYVYLLLSGVRQQQKTLGEAVNKAVDLFFKNVLLNLLVAAALIVSFLLLIVPFFFVLPRVVLTTYFLVDKDLGVVDSFKASWNATEGNVGKVYGIIGAYIAMAALMITIIGIPFSIYFLIMYAAAFAVLYEFLTKHKAPAAEPEVLEPAPTA